MAMSPSDRVELQDRLREIFVAFGTAMHLTVQPLSARVNPKRRHAAWEHLADEVVDFAEALEE